jgi:hypothetical protein
MPPERSLLSVLYEGLFLALAHRLAAQSQGLQSTERESSSFTQYDVSPGSLLSFSSFHIHLQSFISQPISGSQKFPTLPEELSYN